MGEHHRSRGQFWDRPAGEPSPFAALVKLLADHILAAHSLSEGGLCLCCRVLWLRRERYPCDAATTALQAIEATRPERRTR
ncbi:hypothetical protein AB0M43_22320 [Longispora sp. NPDC051575]|uniref:hypothetical protein n=1 Tax=Longispora sp. NPDC051575 TaxID=3154943 RepID=UPI00343E6797